MIVRYCREYKVYYLDVKRYSDCTDFIYLNNRRKNFTPPKDISLKSRDDAFYDAVLPPKLMGDKSRIPYTCIFLKNVISYAWKAFWIKDV